MTRKTILSLLLLCSTNTWAFCGYYVGAGLGPEMADFHQAAKITHPSDMNVTDVGHHAGSGVFGTIFAGVERNFTDANLLFYLAGEINANVSSLEFHSNNNEYFNQNFSTTRYKLPWNIGVSILPGYWFLDDTLFYARLGYALSQFRVSTGDVSLQNLEKNLNGIRYGLGLRRLISDQFSIRVEFDRAEYQNARMRTLDPNSNVLKKTVVSPVTLEVLIALVYNFWA